MAPRPGSQPDGSLSTPQCTAPAIRPPDKRDRRKRAQPAPGASRRRVSRAVAPNTNADGSRPGGKIVKFNRSGGVGGQAALWNNAVRSASRTSMSLSTPRQSGQSAARSATCGRRNDSIQHGESSPGSCMSTRAPDHIRFEGQALPRTTDVGQRHRPCKRASPSSHGLATCRHLNTVVLRCPRSRVPEPPASPPLEMAVTRT
jgi:hypothetical protein